MHKLSTLFQHSYAQVINRLEWGILFKNASKKRPQKRRIKRKIWLSELIQQEHNCLPFVITFFDGIFYLLASVNDSCMISLIKRLCNV